MAVLWQDGLNPPEEVQAATQEYREEMDVLADFLADSAPRNPTPAIKTRAGDLYKAYTTWADKAGEKHHMSEKAFGTALGERGID